jgi:hypothetical protein
VASADLLIGLNVDERFSRAGSTDLVDRGFPRQAQDDPNVRLSLGGATGAAPGTAASN